MLDVLIEAVQPLTTKLIESQGALAFRLHIPIVAIGPAKAGTPVFHAELDRRHGARPATEEEIERERDLLPGDGEG